MGSTPRILPVSNEQFNIMLEYVKKNPDLFFGKVTENFTAHMKRALWAEVAEKLNNTETGCRKTVGKWIQTWNLWKSTVKRRAETREKYLTKGLKVPVSIKELSEVEERCYALILSNDKSYDSDDDCSKEAADSMEKNSFAERTDDSEKKILDAPEAMQGVQIKTNDSPDMRKENGSISVSEDNSNSEKQQSPRERIVDSTGSFAPDDSLPKGDRPMTRNCSLPKYDYTPVAKMRLSLAKRIRLTSAKRMRLSAPEKAKISGSRKMKATTAGTVKRRASEKVTRYPLNKLLEYVSETVKKSAAEQQQIYAAERMNPRVEIIKGYPFEKKVESPHEEKQYAAEAGSSKERVEEAVAQKNKNSVSENRIHNPKPEMVMDVEPDKSDEVKKMADAVTECVHGSLSGDWKDAIVEKLKDVITGKITDIIAEKVRDAISDRVQNDISVNLKDAISKLPKDSASQSSKSDEIVPVKEDASTEVVKAAEGDEMKAGCSIKVTDVRSVSDADGLTKPGKKSEESEGDRNVLENHKESEKSVKSRNKFTATERSAFPELSDIKMEDVNLAILEKGKRTGHDEESSSDEEVYMRPPSKKRIKYTENVVGELRLLQSSRLERLDTINRTLKTNARAMFVLSKTIDNNTDAINNLAKVINSAGSLFLTSFD